VGQSERAKPQNRFGNEDGTDACCGIAAGAVEEANAVANTLLVELVELVLVADAHAIGGGESPIGFSANSVTRNREKTNINPK
jgi:hypothetical protein